MRTILQERGFSSRYFLTFFLDSAMSMARTARPLEANSWLMSSTSASSSRQYLHQVVQNSSRTTLPFRDSLLKLSPSMVRARKRGAGSGAPDPAYAARTTASINAGRIGQKRFFDATCGGLYHDFAGPADLAPMMHARPRPLGAPSPLSLKMS